MSKKICILVPVLNEADNIGKLYSSVVEIFRNLNYDFEMLFIDDGSTDQTMKVLREISATQKNIRYVSFSRNFGKDNALLAGIRNGSGDAFITMDADLQHPPSLIPTLISEWEKGHRIVYTYRDNQNIHSSSISNLFSKLFYASVNRFSEIKLEQGIADFRLMDKEVVENLKDLKEDNPFFRGMVKWLGYNQKAVKYTPDVRKEGTSKYRTKALFRLGLNGIVSFSSSPLHLALYLGFFFSLLSILYIPYAIISKLEGVAISGWSSIIVTIAFFGGMQLMILGIMGIYLGKIFIQSKSRPHYIISETNL